MTTYVHRAGSAARTLIGCLIVLAPVAASSWSQATHAYIADRLGARAGADDLNEMWGSVGPDLVNFIFDPAVCPGWVADQTHGLESDTFLKLWNAARTEKEAALAFGFVSHNQQWGADFTAHVSGLTSGQGVGYVLSKAAALLATPTPTDPRQTFDDAFAGVGIGPGLRPDVAHVVVEYAIDLRLRNEVAPWLGRKLARAARGETSGFTDLFARGFGADYAAYCFHGDASLAASAVAEAVAGHRADMIFLGEAISRPEPAAVRLLAEQLASVLGDALGAPLPEPKTIEILQAGLLESMTLCDDYAREIEATIEFVDGNLKDHDIGPRRHGRSR